MSESQKPLQMIYAAQEQADKWAHELRRCRQGVNTSISHARAQRELHTAVILYYEQLARVSHKQHIQGLWHEQPINPQVLGDGWLDEEATLEEVADIRLETERVEQEYYDEDADKYRTEEVRRAVALGPEEALAVKDQLDRCAQELGIGLSVADQRPRFHIDSPSPAETVEPSDDDQPELRPDGE